MFFYTIFSHKILFLSFRILSFVWFNFYYNMQSLSDRISYHFLLSVCAWIWSYLRWSYLIVPFYLFDFILSYLISSIHLSTYFMTRLNSMITKLMVVYLVLSCFTWCYIAVIFHIILFSLYISISDQVSLFKPFYLRELWFIL